MIREIKVISVGPSILRFQFVVVPDRPPLIIKTSSQGGDGLTRVLAAASTTGKHIDDSAGRARNVFLDRKRNSNREAIRSLEKEAKAHFKGGNSKSWLAMGNSFFRLPNRNAVNMLKKDQHELDISVNKLRSELKIDVNNLREKEGKEELKGFGLNALSKEEFKAVNGVIRANAQPTPKYYFK